VRDFLCHDFFLNYIFLQMSFFILILVPNENHVMKGVLWV